MGFVLSAATFFRSDPVTRHLKKAVKQRMLRLKRHPRETTFEAFVSKLMELDAVRRGRRLPPGVGLGLVVTDVERFAKMGGDPAASLDAAVRAELELEEQRRRSRHLEPLRSRILQVRGEAIAAEWAIKVAARKLEQVARGKTRSALLDANPL